MEKQEIVAELVQLVAQAEVALSSEGIKDANPLLFKKARLAFGEWEEALAAALCYAAQGRRRKVSQATVSAEGSHARQRQEGWDCPVFVLTAQQRLCQRSAAAWAAQGEGAVPEAFAAAEVELDVLDLLPGVEEGALVLFSRQGEAWAVDERLIPDADESTRAAADVSGLGSGGEVGGWALRRSLRGAARFFHVTAQGRIKAGESAELQRGLGREGVVAFLLAPDDQAVAVFGQDREEHGIFCASAAGQGIHFKADEVRSMGLRAQGVKAMELEADDALIGACAVRGDEQALVISALGFGKRVSLEEFRAQGRGGQGMILMRPHVEGDRVAALHRVRALDEDVLVVTSRGRVARVAVGAFPLAGRAARGAAVLALAPGERVVGARGLPGAGA